jgi:hypothetical protein
VLHWLRAVAKNTAFGEKSMQKSSLHAICRVYDAASMMRAGGEIVIV